MITQTGPLEVQGVSNLHQAAVKGHMAIASEFWERSDSGKRLVYYCIRSNFLIPFICSYISQYLYTDCLLSVASPLKFADPLHELLYFSPCLSSNTHSLLAMQ